MRVELKIIDFLARNKDKKFTINKIAKNIKEHYSFVHKTINKLNKENIIIKTKAGKAHLCSLNTDNEKAIILIQLSEIEKKNELYNKNGKLKLMLEDFIKSIKTQPNLLSIILFGSYSKGNTTKESDIDILILSKKNINIEKITKEIYAKYGKEINPIIMTPNDFKKQKDKPIIKEIINNHHILYGIENFTKEVHKKWKQKT